MLESRNEQFLLKQEFGKLPEWLAIIKYEYGILPEWAATLYERQDLWEDLLRRVLTGQFESP